MKPKSQASKRSQVPRHPSNIPDQHMVGGYRPRYKEGFQRQTGTHVSNRLSSNERVRGNGLVKQSSQPPASGRTQDSRSSSRKPNQNTYSSNSNIYS